MSGILLHIDGEGLGPARLGDLCDGVASLLSRLQHHGVPAALLLQCTAAAEAGPGLAAVQAAAHAAGAPLLVTQPSQLPVSLRLALAQLAGMAPQGAVFISVADSSSAASQAAELGCASVEQLAPRSTSEAALHAAALQAVVRQAAATRQAQGLAPPLVVGYVMKQSRQLALTQQGMLPLLGAPPAADAPVAPAGSQAAAAAAAPAPAPAAAEAGPGPGAERPLCFVPLDLHSPLPRQLAGCHMVLQKLTDCLQGGGSGAVAALTSEAQALLAALEQATAAAAAAGEVPICLVDPAAALQPIMDRAALVQHLEAATLAVRQQAIPMRAPATTALLTRFDAAATPRALAAAGVGLPCIVKPQAACGVAEAHQMAFVLHSSGFAGLEAEVPLPAVAQEYVDHGGVVWKVYVAGQQVFWMQRRSTPDLGPLVAALAADPEGADAPASLGFDSLKSLPTSLPWLRRGAPADGAPPPGHELLRRPTFEAVAAALRARLGLTLFGFDLVFDPSAGELVCIDVNYFPSFKGAPEAPAALGAALRQRYAEHAAAAARG